jgi:hypothetical protein
MDMILTPAELTVFAGLVAGFNELNRRQPNDGETTTLLSVARMLGASARTAPAPLRSNRRGVYAG